MQLSRETKRQSPNIIFAVLLIGCMIGSFLQTALATALPVIMKDFQISAPVGQWLTSAYSLAMGIMVPATAFLIRRFPARNLFLIFMAIFTAGSSVSAAAFSFPVLMVGRILQALGCGVVLSLTQVVIVTIFPMEKRGAMMGIYGLAVSAVPVFAPSLAGLVIDYVGWQSIFWVIAALAALDFLVGVKAMSSPMETVRQRFDLLSMVLCTLGFCGVTLALGNLGTNSLVSVYVLLPFLVGAVSLVLFTMRQLHMREPFLDVRTLANREFRLSVIGSMMMYAVMIAGSTLLPIYIQSMRGYTAAVSGLVMMPGSLVMALASPFVGKIYDKIGIRKLLHFGSGALLLSCIGACGFNDFTPLWYIILIFVLRSLSIGMFMMPLATWGLSTIPSERTASGTALLTSLRTIAGSIGSAGFVALMSVAVHSPNPRPQIFGLYVSFVGISVISAVLFLTAIIFVRKNSSAALNQEEGN